jgi:hypothetical protein
MSKGENNERCVGGDDEDDPPHVNIEKAHTVSHPKRKISTSNKGSSEF